MPDDFYSTLAEAAKFKPDSVSPPHAWVGHMHFAAWAIRMIRPKIFVELGAHIGNSYFSFCQSNNENALGCACFAVDTWKGDEHAGFYGEEIYGSVADHNSRRFASFSTLIRSDFDDALKRFNNKSIELLHIDGCHSYEAVRHDYECWLPKLAPGAVVMFHDTDSHLPGYGVDAFWSEVTKTTPFHLQFRHSNGLGVMQLKDTERPPHAWLVEGSPEKHGVELLFSLVGVRFYHQLERPSVITVMGDAFNRDIDCAERLIASWGRRETDIGAQLQASANTVREQGETIRTKTMRENLLRKKAWSSEKNEAFLKTRLHSLEEKAVSLETKAESLSHDAAALRASTSWKITAPLRAVVNATRFAGGFNSKVALFVKMRGGWVPALRRLSDVCASEGVWGTAKRIVQWAPPQAVVPPVRSSGVNIESLVPLEEMLAGDTTALRRILHKANRPIAIFNHAMGGGSEDYCLVRIRKLLEQGFAILFVRYHPAKRLLTGKAAYGGASVSFRFQNIEELGDARFPRITRFVLNNFVGWRVRADDRLLSDYESVPVLLNRLMSLAKLHGASCEVPHHDHYCICPRYTLLNHKAEFCGIPDDGTECKRCLADLFPYFAARGGMAAWRQSWQTLFDNADALVFFSQSSRRLFEKVFSISPRRAKFLPHDPVIAWNERYHLPSAEAPMTVAVIGGINKQKGVDLVMEMAKLMNESERIVFIGSVHYGRPVPDNVSITGRYELTDLPRLLREHKVTVGFMSSIWPETFSYTTQECMALRLPLACFDIGAQAERIGSWEQGMITPEITPESALATLRRLDARRSAPRAAAPRPSSGDNAALDDILPARLPKNTSVRPRKDESPVDVVLPVYNGFDFLVPCLDSVLAGIDVPFRLFLNDDASEDPRISEYFKTVRHRYPKGIVKTYANTVRRGFTESVTKMLADTDHDVVLVNSDTVFPDRWASRLLWPIRHSGKKVASSTPFSNSGTSCAFPHMNADNELFAGMELAEIDAVFGLMRPEAYIEMPTGVGFCMAMAKEALSDIGSLDAETFSPGYGEEVDWCRRASQFGYAHALVPNLFVYHKHGGSYKRVLSDERRSLLDKHNRIVDLRYPEYSAALREFFAGQNRSVLRAALLFLVCAKAGGTRSPPIVSVNGSVLSFRHGEYSGDVFFRDSASVSRILEMGKRVTS